MYGTETKVLRRFARIHRTIKDIHDPGLEESLNSDSVTTQTSVHSMKELFRRWYFTFEKKELGSDKKKSMDVD